MPGCLEFFDLTKVLPYEYRTSISAKCAYTALKSFTDNSNLLFLRSEVEALGAELASLSTRIADKTGSARKEWKMAIDELLASRVEAWKIRRTVRPPL